MTPIPFATGYFVRADGTIWSTHRSDRLMAREGELHQVRGGLAKSGYRVVRLRTSSGRYRTCHVHVLVAEAFLGPRPSPKHQVRHLDGTRGNNRRSNLAWGTASENHEDSRRHGTLPRGSRSNLSRLDEVTVARILEERARGDLIRIIAARHGVSKTAVQAISANRTWKHVPRKDNAA